MTESFCSPHNVIARHHRSRGHLLFHGRLGSQSHYRTLNHLSSDLVRIEVSSILLNNDASVIRIDQSSQILTLN